MKIEYYIIKVENDCCNSIDSLNHLLLSNSKVNINQEQFKIGNKSVKYEVTTKLISNNSERLFHVIFSHKDDNIEECVSLLEKTIHLFKKIIRESGHDFKINIIWDEISHYYCKLSYPSINSIENKMRKLIFRFMVENIGSNWIETSIPEELKKTLKDNVKRAKLNFIQNLLYEADFIHLMKFMFEPYTTISGIKELFDKINSVKNKKDIEELQTLQPRSNWERYFSSFIKMEKLEDKWTTLYIYRNKIAHNKLVSRSDYEKLLKLCKSIEKCLSQALATLDKSRVPDSEKDNLRKIALQSIVCDIKESGILNNDIANINYCSICGKSYYVNSNLKNTNSNICPDCSMYKRMFDMNDSLYQMNTIIDNQILSSRLENYSLPTMHQSCRQCGKPYISSGFEGIENGLCSSCYGNIGIGNVYGPNEGKNN